MILILSFKNSISLSSFFLLIQFHRRRVPRNKFILTLDNVIKGSTLDIVSEKEFIKKFLKKREYNQKESTNRSLYNLHFEKSK